MSGILIVRALLVADAPLVASVPASRIRPFLPQGVTLPALGLDVVSAVRRNALSGNETTVHEMSRVRVTALAASYSSCEAVLALVNSACARKRGTIAGFADVHVLPDIRGPDMQDVGANIFMQSLDFLVHYTAT